MTEITISGRKHFPRWPHELARPFVQIRTTRLRARFMSSWWRRTAN